jgi:hypothetical protein
MSRIVAAGASLLAFALAIGGMACGESAPITGPDPLQQPSASPAPAPASSSSIRGTVFEHTMSGARPLGGVRIHVFQSLPNVPREQVVDVTTGADGSFSVAKIESSHFVRAQVAAGSSYFTPCPTFTWSQATPLELDVHVVSGAILSTAGMPPSYPTQSLPLGGFRALISGRVVERTAGGLEPVSAATVAMAEGSDTLSDANGRYLLCSIGNTEVAVTVSASKPGYGTASAHDLPWFGWDLDFELTRR